MIYLSMIQGFDAQGTELYWTVTGDNVSCLSLVDTNEDGVLELLVSKNRKPHEHFTRFAAYSNDEV